VGIRDRVKRLEAANTAEILTPMGVIPNERQTRALSPFAKGLRADHGQPRSLLNRPLPENNAMPRSAGPNPCGPPGALSSLRAPRMASEGLRVS
jgi:hypothetical protein